MTLYEIAPELREAVMAEDFDEQLVTDLAIAFENKAFGMMSIADELTAFVTMAKAEEKRIADKRKAVENRINRMKDYLQHNMETAEVFEVEQGTRKITLQKNPPKVVVDDEQAIPPRFYTVIPESFQLDKNALKTALKDGDVPGAHLEQGYSLRVK
jgi:hypothetical protein